MSIVVPNTASHKVTDSHVLIEGKKKLVAYHAMITEDVFCFTLILLEFGDTTFVKALWLHTSEFRRQ